MADLLLLPNVSALVTAFYRAQPEVIALVGDRVVTELGKSQDWPAIRVTQFNDQPTIPRPLVHTRTDLQIDCFGGPKSLAWTIAETCRAAAVARLSGRVTFHVDSHTIDALVTRCTASGLRDLPDAEFNPARPRWLFTLAVWSRAPRRP